MDCAGREDEVTTVAYADAIGTSGGGDKLHALLLGGILLVSVDTVAASVLGTENRSENTTLEVASLFFFLQRAGFPPLRPHPAGICDITSFVRFGHRLALQNHSINF